MRPALQVESIKELKELKELNLTGVDTFEITKVRDRNLNPRVPLLKTSSTLDRAP